MKRLALAALVLTSCSHAPDRVTTTEAAPEPISSSTTSTLPTHDHPSSYEITLPSSPTSNPARQPARASRARQVAPVARDVRPERPATIASGDTRRVSSTAYCLTGRMANGEYVHAGAVAMNGVPFGSVWENVATGQRYVVKDRIGHSSQFDIWMGSCAHARGYGRRVITIRRVS